MAGNNFVLSGGRQDDPHRLEWQGDQLIVTGRTGFKE